MLPAGPQQAYAGLVAEGCPPPSARARVVAGVAASVQHALAVDLPASSLMSRWGPPVDVELEGCEPTPWLLGAVHESLLGQEGRRARGAFYTSPEVAATVVAWALDGLAVDEPVVCDPAVGGGVFLLAVADALARRGGSPSRIVQRCLVGADIDPVAVAVSEAALALWCGGSAVPRVVVGDALALEPGDWPGRPHVVVGNPPFLNQLARSTVRSRAEADELRRRFGPLARGLVDTAVLFLLAGLRLVRPGGTVALVLPQSFLATRDAAPARAAVATDAALEVLWLPSTSLFDAAVRVCVPVVRRGGGPRSTVRVCRGVPPAAVHDIEVDGAALAAAPSWSHLVVTTAEVPDCRFSSDATLEQWCRVHADFRQQYYGVAPFLVDDPEDGLDDTLFPRLVTSGLVDAAACRWGRRATRHHGHRWRAPRVDLARLEAESDLGGWARSRLVPKVVVATQTRVVEAAVDASGSWLPSTPLLSVVAPAERLWHAAAVLLSPVVTAWALRHWGGAALAADAIKLSAGQVRAVPLPAAGPDWDEAAAAVARASAAGDEDDRRRWLLAAAAASCRAYEVDPSPLCPWWAARLPGATPSSLTPSGRSSGRPGSHSSSHNRSG